ncbi:hypothetical protein DOY81_001440 [Sarcophaga bullata]|nr:hypothetical protein DOY81_001440 [Sarcophaga bullata]
MTCIKLIALLVLIICLMPEPQVSAKFWHKWCNNRCSTYENTIFTTDGTDCIILRNSCYLNRENCQRRRYGLPGLTVTSQTYCQARCRTTCGTEKSPVCGEYRGTYTTYDNDCLLIKAACDNAQSIVKVYNSACSTQG